MPGQKKGAGLGRNPVTPVHLTHAVGIRRLGIRTLPPFRDDIPMVQQLLCPGEGYYIAFTTRVV